MEKDGEISAYILWVILNIILPISPLLLKLAISFFGTDEVLKTSIFDSVELVFYNLFICITILNMLSEKDSQIEYILKFIFILICIIDLLVLFLIYTGTGNEKCKGYAVFLSVLVPIFALIYKYLGISDK